jgi:CRP-like cAMP-binding protein
VKPRNGMHEIRLIEGSLARLDLCEGLDAQAVRQLALHARMLRVPRGQAIVRRGERPAGVFAVVHGAVKARLQHEDGDEAIVALLGPGGTFGKAATLLDHASKLDLVALEECLLIEIDAGAVSAQISRDPRFARNVASSLAAKAQALMTEFEHSMQPTLRRLVAYLDSIAEPTAEPDVWAARLPVSKTVVAARLGMKKETLSRLLQRLARRGVIEVARREITILDRARLAEASSDRARSA